MTAAVCKLPVTYPFIVAYTTHATTLSIVTNYDDYLPWFCSNYVQLRVVHDLSSRAWVDFYSLMPGGVHHCPYLETQHIHLPTLRALRGGIVEFLIEMIGAGYYVYACVETSCISAYHSYGKYRFPHTMLIYGYDREQKLFHIGDFLRANYAYGTAGFDEVERAFAATTVEEAVGFHGLKLLRYKPDADYKFHLGNVAELVGDYLHSRPTSRRYLSHVQPFGPESLGMDPVYTRLGQDLELNIDNPDIFQYPSFHVLYEHKKALSLIYNYMRTIGCIDESHRFDAVEEKALSVRNTVMKYSLTRDPRFVRSALDALRELYQLEQEALTRLLPAIG